VRISAVKIASLSVELFSVKADTKRKWEDRLLRSSQTGITRDIMQVTAELREKLRSCQRDAVSSGY